MVKSVKEQAYRRKAYVEYIIMTSIVLTSLKLSNGIKISTSYKPVHDVTSLSIDTHDICQSRTFHRDANWQTDINTISIAEKVYIK